MTDRELLEQVARQRSEPAFTEIARRHLDLVYSAALRQLGNPDAARDVAQNVFILLARQAARLAGEVVLTGWLYRTTRNLCLETIRNDRRRREREQAAAENIMNNETANPWDQIAPSLEPAMDELTEADRQAVLLRFFQNKNLRDVGAELGIGEDAAQKRVSRALEKLREIFGKRGVTLPAALLAATISGSAVQAAPAGILTFVTTAAIGTGLAAATTTLVTQTTTSTMNLLNLKTAVAVVAAAGVTGTSTYLVKERETDRLRADNQSLNEARAKLSDEQKQTQAAIQLRDDQIAQLKKEVADLPRVRGEVDRLNRDLLNQKSLAAENDRLKEEQRRLQGQLRDLQVAGASGNGARANAGIPTGADSSNLNTPPRLVTRSYHFAPDFLDELRNRTLNANDASPSELFNSYLKQSGVILDPPSMVFLNERTGVIMVRGETNQLELVDRIVTRISTGGN